MDQRTIEGAMDCASGGSGKIEALGNGSYKKVCGFCTFVHTMWKGTKLHREFTSDIHSYKKKIVTFYHLITNNRFVTMHKL
jgi:hypothetical protein